MKNLFFSAVAITLLASCSGSEIDEVIDNGQPVAIQLSAEVQATTVMSRAAITGETKFKATVLAWEATGVAPNYSTTPEWVSTTSDITATGNTPEISLTEKRYYNTDKDVKTYMKAFYAEGATINSISGWKYDFQNTDGTKDVLIASAILGDRNTPATAFAFTHPLMQLKFKLVAGPGFPDDVTVASITINNAVLPVGVDMSDNSVTYASAAALVVPNLTDAPIPSDESGVGECVMVQPFSGGKFTVTIVTNKKTYTDIPVSLTLNAGTGAGVAYLVTLTFQEKISVSAGTTDWSTGVGAGTVE